MKTLVITVFMIFGFVPFPALAAKCNVNDPDISKEYIGECKNGLANGIGVAKGRDEYNGPFFNGNPHGRGSYAWGASSSWPGQRYSGDFVNGNRTGKGKLSFGDGAVYEGDFVNGSLTGKGIVSFIDGRTYIGDFLNSKSDGFGIYTVPLKVYVGNKYSGKGVLTSENYIEKGLFRGGEFLLACPDFDACVKTWIKTENDKKVAQENQRIEILKSEQIQVDSERNGKMDEYLQKRQACENQKQICIASCPADRSKKYYLPEPNCSWQCRTSISCY